MKIEALAKLAVERLKYEQDERVEQERQRAHDLRQAREEARTGFQRGQSSVTRLYDKEFRDYLLNSISREMAPRLVDEIAARALGDIVQKAEIRGVGDPLAPFDGSVSTIQFTVPAFHRRYALMKFS